MVYLSLWLHEPLLDDNDDVLLESMLIETELRWHKNHTMDNNFNVLFHTKVATFGNLPTAHLISSDTAWLKASFVIFLLKELNGFG